MPPAPPEHQRSSSSSRTSSSCSIQHTDTLTDTYTGIWTEHTRPYMHWYTAQWTGTRVGTSVDIRTNIRLDKQTDKTMATWTDMYTAVKRENSQNILPEIIGPTAFFLHFQSIQSVDWSVSKIKKCLRHLWN